jgi:hypothetical protein
LAGEPLDIAGRWRVQFERDPHPSVGVFEADPYAPGEVRGTFLTVTGDYRYLAGTARGDERLASASNMRRSTPTISMRVLPRQ